MSLKLIRVKFQVADYVKNGKTKAHIELEIISNRNGDVSTFHRAFGKDAKEIFTVDGTKVSKKDYLQRVKAYNIQVDNLCMFLPQDRVQDFTKMNPQELLLNTQLSVCSADTNAAFKDLLSTRDKQLKKDDIKTDIQTRLDDNRNRNDQLKGLIESSNLKKQLEEKVKVLTIKKDWLAVDAIKDELKVIEADIKTLTDKIKKKNDELKPIKAKQESLAASKAEIKNDYSKALTSLSERSAAIEKLHDASANVESEVNRSKQDLKNKIASAQDHKKQVNEMELLINLQRNDLNDARVALANEGDIEERIREHDSGLGKHKATVGKLMAKRDGLNKKLDETIVPSARLCQRKINTLSDTQKQRFNLLRNNHEDAFKAYQWLEGNRQNFNGKIFNPIMVEMTVKEQKYAKYIENTVGIKDLVAFICTNKQDMARLIQKLRNEMRLQVNVAYSEASNQVNFQSTLDLSQLPPELGIYSYLVDMFEAPAPIVNYLCRLYNIHNVAVGDDRTFQNASQVPSSIRLFFSTNNRFAVNISRYSNAKSVSSSVIQDRNILNVGVDPRQKEHEEKNLQKWMNEEKKTLEARGAIENEIKQYENEMKEIRDAKNALSAKQKHLELSAEKLRRKEAEFEKFKNQKINVEEEREKFKKIVASLIGKLMKIVDKQFETLTEYKNFQVQRHLATRKLEVFETSTGNLDEEIRRHQNEIATTTSLCDRIRIKHDEMSNRRKTIEAKVLKLTGGVSPKHPTFNLKAEFDELAGKSIEEITAEIEDSQGRINCINDIDPNLVIEFEARRKEIAEQENQLANEQNRLEKMENDLKQLHEKWFPAIQKVITTINEKFSNFFNLMGFVGEVDMVRKEEVS